MTTVDGFTYECTASSEWLHTKKISGSMLSRLVPNDCLRSVIRSSVEACARRTGTRPHLAPLMPRTSLLGNLSAGGVSSAQRRCLHVVDAADPVGASQRTLFGSQRTAVKVCVRRKVTRDSVDCIRNKKRPEVPRQSTAIHSRGTALFRWFTHSILNRVHRYTRATHSHTRQYKYNHNLIIN